MLHYDMPEGAEAFSTNIGDPLDFEVALPDYQAHSTRVAVIPRDSAHTHGCDALVTNRPGLRIGVKTADCVPVLLYDHVGKAVAAIHSGWKGTLANICAVTVTKMREEYATDPANLTAVIGPCIHLEAFEVGDDLRDRFAEAGYADFCRRLPRFATDTDIKWHIDLPGICRHQLESLGTTRIEVRPECTYTLHHHFYSARRLGPDFGDQRILSCIMLKLKFKS